MTDLTPTEDLLIDGLVARARCGESWWTYEYKHRKTLASLEAKGLIWTEPASTPHIEAHLTDAGREEFMSPTYTPQGARVEWAVQAADDAEPVHYRVDDRDSEEWHRRYADRHDGVLFRRAVPVLPWVRVVEARR